MQTSERKVLDVEKISGIYLKFGLINFVKYCRYLELVYPIWHRTHFKMRYIYRAITFVWIFGLGFIGAYMISTSRVSLLYLEIVFKSKALLYILVQYISP